MSFVRQPASKPISVDASSSVSADLFRTPSPRPEVKSVEVQTDKDPAAFVNYPESCLEDYVPSQEAVKRYGSVYVSRTALFFSQLTGTKPPAKQTTSTQTFITTRNVEMRRMGLWP